MEHALPPVLSAIALTLLILAVTAIGRRLPVPTPVLQVIAGLLVGLVPGSAVLKLDPGVVFFVFLPPVLWAAAYFTSWRDFSANLKPIGLLAIGLVLATTAAVAFAAHALLPGIPWAVAVALGAIVSPPDAVAAEAILKRLPVPRWPVVVLQGESLVNDASALVLYRTAVVAAATGFFSLGESVVRFFVDASVGIVIGLIVGWVLIRLAKLTRDSMAEVILSLLGPYLAWVSAESLHVSAVLACVAGGLYVRQHYSSAVSPASRIQTRAVWDLLVFVLNSLIFLLLGVQFGELIEAVPATTLGSVTRTGLIISAIAIVVRLVWVPVVAVLPRLMRDRAVRHPAVTGKVTFLVGWTSMRGIVSLASAMALPLVLDSGQPFPYRAEIILITMIVIVVTLVLQGLSLAPLIRWLRFPGDAAPQEEESHARQEALRHALERIDDLADEPWVRREDADLLREEYRRHARLHTASADGHTEGADARRRLRAEVLRAERRALIRLRNEGAISDEVLHQLERELDVEALRIGEGEAR